MGRGSIVVEEAIMLGIIIARHASGTASGSA